MIRPASWLRYAGHTATAIAFAALSAPATAQSAPAQPAVGQLGGSGPCVQGPRREGFGPKGEYVWLYVPIGTGIPRSGGTCGDNRRPVIFIAPGYSPSVMHERFLAEPRDELWASKREASLRASLAGPTRVSDGASVSVECRRSSCEISAVFSHDDSTDLLANKRAVALFQQRFNETHARSGLTSSTAAPAVIFDPSDPSRIGVLAYLSRSVR